MFIEFFDLVAKKRTFKSRVTFFASLSSCRPAPPSFPRVPTLDALCPFHRSWAPRPAKSCGSIVFVRQTGRALARQRWCAAKRRTDGLRRLLHAPPPRPSSTRPAPPALRCSSTEVSTSLCAFTASFSLWCGSPTRFFRLVSTQHSLVCAPFAIAIKSFCTPIEEDTQTPAANRSAWKSLFNRSTCSGKLSPARQQYLEGRRRKIKWCMWKSGRLQNVWIRQLGVRAKHPRPAHAR